MALKRDLNLTSVFAIASGAMISSGLFVLPGLAHARAGPAVVISYLLAGLLASTGMLSIAELGTAMPKAGGDYFFIARGMGPALGTVAGLLSWFSLSMKSAFALVGMASFLRVVAPIDVRIAAAFFTVAFVLVNIAGVKESGRLQVGLVGGLIFLLAVYILSGITAIRIDNFVPFAPQGVAAVLSTTGFIFVSYGGIINIASVAEEIEEPGRVIPLGMVLTLIVVSLLYTLTVFVTTGVLPGAELDHSLTPISDGAFMIFGSIGQVILSVAAIFAFVSTANAGILASSRYLVALGRDDLLPNVMSRVNQQSGAPRIAILFTGIIVLLAVFLNLDTLVEAASTVIILTFIFSNLSVIVLRESRLQNYRPNFISPLYPWVQITGIGVLTLILLEMGTIALMTSAGLITGGFLIYFLYGRKRSQKEYALLHIIDHVTEHTYTRGVLEKELKEIVRERDSIVSDRIDEIIEKSQILDIHEKTTKEELFDVSSRVLAKTLKKNYGEIANLLNQPEEISPVVNSLFAVPRITVPGQRIFEILLVRCRKGVFFSEKYPEVKAVFVLAGSADERNLFLRVLAALSSIVQEPDFEKRWLSAKNDQALRDVLLLGRRMRE